MMDFYVRVITYLQKVFPLTDRVLIASTALNSNNRKARWTLKCMQVLAKSFPHVIPEEEVSLVQDEWKAYQADDDIVERERGMRIDHWWNSVFKLKTSFGQRKYPHLEKLVKSVLSLPNGNAATERSLSDNKRTVDAERDHLMEQTIINLRLMKEHARSCGGAENVLVTDEMISGMRDAKQEDGKRIQAEKEKKEEAIRRVAMQKEEELNKQKLLEDAAKLKKSLEEREDRAEKDEERMDEDLEIAKRTLSDASKSLKAAIEKNDNIGIKMASELVESSQKKISALSDARKKHTNNLSMLKKKRKSTIDSMFATIQKKKSSL